MSQGRGGGATSVVVLGNLDQRAICLENILHVELHGACFQHQIELLSGRIIHGWCKLAYLLIAGGTLAALPD